MLIAALCIALAIVCAYSWFAYKIKTTVSDVKPTVPASLDEPTSKSLN